MRQAFFGEFLNYCSLGKLTHQSKLKEQSKPIEFELVYNNETFVYPVYAIPNKLSFSDQRCQQLYSQFIADIKISFAEELTNTKSSAIIIATTCYDLPLMENQLVEPNFSTNQLNPLNQLEIEVSSALDFTGPCFTINTACSSSSNAALYAKKLICSQNFDNVLIVSVEFINRISVSGFSSLQLLRQSQYKPFEQCSGMILGECLSAQLLSNNDHNATYRLIDGFNSVDTNNITTSDPQGNGFNYCISKALDRANINYNNIKLVKSHGVGTESSDHAEVKAMKQFSEINDTAIVSLKPWIGHTLAASGLAELQILHTLKNEELAHLTEIDDSHFELVYKPINLQPGDIILSNQFAFGGNNSSLVLEKV